MLVQQIVGWRIYTDKVNLYVNGMLKFVFIVMVHQLC